MKKILRFRFEIIITFIVMLGTIYSYYLTFDFNIEKTQLFAIRVLIVLLIPATYVTFRTFRKCLKEEILWLKGNKYAKANDYIFRNISVN